YNKLAAVGDPKFPYVISTYRLTEHYLAGAMSRWLPWLAELQPELFIELGHDLAKEKGIKNLDWVVVSSPRGHIRAKALVTHRIGVMHIAGKPIHHVGMPWHWGWMGLPAMCITPMRWVTSAFARIWPRGLDTTTQSRFLIPFSLARSCPSSMNSSGWSSASHGSQRLIAPAR